MLLLVKSRQAVGRMKARVLLLKIPLPFLLTFTLFFVLCPQMNPCIPSSQTLWSTWWWQNQPISLTLFLHDTPAPVTPEEVSPAICVLKGFAAAFEGITTSKLFRFFFAGAAAREGVAVRSVGKTFRAGRYVPLEEII